MGFDPLAAGRAPRRRRRWVGPSVLALLAMGATVALVPSLRARLPAMLGGGPAPAPVERQIPAGTRVKVEVFNATDTRGLARTAAFVLRDAGFDVVFFGNTTERLDSTLVRDRSGHAGWATAAALTMAPAATEVRPDSGRLVDLTILVGRRWRPPTEPFRP